MDNQLSYNAHYTKIERLFARGITLYQEGFSYPFEEHGAVQLGYEYALAAHNMKTAYLTRVRENFPAPPN